MLERALTLLLTLPLAAQSRWIVDANNGPGTDFTSLAIALADARVVDGDVLTLRAGTYAPINTSKAVSILGEGSPLIVATSFHVEHNAVTVRAIPAGRAFALVGVRVEHDCTGTRGAILVQQTAGRVHLEDVHTRGIGYPPSLIPICNAVSLDRAALVTWNRGSLRTAGGIRATSSTLVLTAVACEGLNGSDSGIPGTGIIPCTPALLVWDSDVQLAQSDLRGGDGSGRVAPCPGIVSQFITRRNSISLAGTAANSVVAGLSTTTAWAPAIQLDGATLVFDPAVTLRGANFGPPIAGWGTAVARTLAFTSGAGAALGGTVQTTIVSPPGDGIFFGLSLPTLAVGTPLGPLFLDLGLMVPLFVGVQNGTGSTAVPVPVPIVTALSGLTVALQAAHSDTANNAIVLTQPVMVAIR